MSTDNTVPEGDFIYTPDEVDQEGLLLDEIEYDEEIATAEDWGEFHMKPSEMKPRSEGWRIDDEDYVDRVREEAKNNPLIIL